MRRIRLAGQLAEPISHYTDGVEAGGFLYVSGMLPLDVNGDVCRHRRRGKAGGTGS